MNAKSSLCTAWTTETNAVLRLTITETIRIYIRIFLVVTLPFESVGCVANPYILIHLFMKLIRVLDIRRWADKFCLHCNIFIYIGHIWIKPVMRSRMASLFQHTSHRCLQLSSSAHRTGRVFRRSVQSACSYWVLNHGKGSSNWNSQTNASR